MVCFVNDDDVVRQASRRCSVAQAEIVCVPAAQGLEGDNVRNGPRCGECVTPHRNKRRGGDNQAATVLLRNRGRNVSLAHAHIVAEQCTVELFQGGSQACRRGCLMWLK